MLSQQPVVFGHEFCGEVVDYGPGTRKTPRTGTPVVALPLVRYGKEVHGIGLSAAAPRAYAERLRRAALGRAVASLPGPEGVGAGGRRAAGADGRRLARRSSLTGGQRRC